MRKLMMFGIMSILMVLCSGAFAGTAAPDTNATEAQALNARRSSYDIVMLSDAEDGQAVNEVQPAIFDSTEYSSSIVLAADPSDNQEAQDEYNDMVKQVLYIVNNYVIRTLMIIVTVVAAVFGIVNFIKFSKATDEENRQKAKKNILGWGLGTIGAFACIWLLPMLFNFLISLMPGTGISPV